MEPIIKNKTINNIKIHYPPSPRLSSGNPQLPASPKLMPHPVSPRLNSQFPASPRLGSQFPASPRLGSQFPSSPRVHHPQHQLLLHHQNPASPRLSSQHVQPSPRLNSQHIIHSPRLTSQFPVSPRLSSQHPPSPKLHPQFLSPPKPHLQHSPLLKSQPIQQSKSSSNLQIQSEELANQIATAVKYQEFQEDFPNSLKRTLWNSVQFAHRHKLIERSAYQERLIIPLAKTAVFDIYNQYLASRVYDGAQFERSVDLKLLAFNHKCLYYKYALDVILDCKELISVGGNKFECPHLMGDPAFGMMELTKALLKQPLPLESEGPPQPMIIGNKFFEIDNLNWLFYRRSYLKIRNLKKLIEAPRGGKVFSIAEASDQALTEMIHRVGMWATGAATAFIEWNVFSKLLERYNQFVYPIPRLIFLDAMVKIHSDLGWMISNRLIQDQFGVSIPFMISDICQMLAPVSIAIIKTYNIKPTSIQQQP
ncbi:hypothetical protein PPL_09363 [Heterostelium album PN500]|uniref:Uncharacterized protein n=1 Tax=Heterostelium pallidum (strain ATCC 26659 / Pp 5 / PN500) TaxID=670386 RepID=D3BLC9_HETP5|nr:hypothetical protein PPL_09363 [Heterostelium album PN500]EFA77863.1 hypothetical protein PPL_09363 [Heterostelium album PN500]|eukprot:XP_020429991.1 hypothetical protein PPL_09363 [Heterostelium album PN500]